MPERPLAGLLHLLLSNLLKRIEAYLEEREMHQFADAYDIPHILGKGVVADGAVLGDLQALGSQSDLSLATWSTEVSRDGGRAGAAANIVRADLGLPPAKG